MKTKLYKSENIINPLIIKEAADIINRGGLVVFPTETVYGIGANALDKDASNKIYLVKGRPSDNPLIVHIANSEDLTKFVEVVDSNAMKLIKEFWPGPLTLIFKKRELIPYEITGGLDTVAIRMPNNDFALELIRKAKVPICAPSANISGKPSSTTYEHVFFDLFGKVDMIIDGGKSLVGIESTVLDLTSEIPTILRPGAITKPMIEKVLGFDILDATQLEFKNEVPKAPGMKYKHYSPSGEIMIIEGTIEKVTIYINKKVKELEKQGKKVAVICASEYESRIECKHISIIGSLENSSEVASNLFMSLREMDALNIDQILIHSFSIEDIGAAIMNRLLKAANNNIVKLN